MTNTTRSQPGCTVEHDFALHVDGPMLNKQTTLQFMQEVQVLVTRGKTLT